MSRLNNSIFKKRESDVIDSMYYNCKFLLRFSSTFIYPRLQHRHQLRYLFSCWQGFQPRLIAFANIGPAYLINSTENSASKSGPSTNPGEQRHSIVKSIFVRGVSYNPD